MNRLELIDQIKTIEYRIKETKQAIKILETKIGSCKVTIERKTDGDYPPTKETIFSNNIFNGIILETLKNQLESDKLDLKSLVLKIYGEVLDQ